MLPHTRHPTRDGVIIGAKAVTWEQVERYYICRICGGKPVHHIANVNGQTVDYAECADCGNRDFQAQWVVEKQLTDAPTVFFNLPDELKALFPEPEPLNMTAEEAIRDVYDL